MKIAIFGDSWGDTRPSYILHKDEDPWTIILNKKYDITNFCEAGSSVYFSAKIFLENYKNFDKIIFLASDRTRRYLPDYSSIIMDSGPVVRHIKENTAESLKHAISDTPRNREILSAIKLYYSYLINDEQDIYYHNLTLNDIQSKLPFDKVLILEDLREISFKEHRYYQNLGYDASHKNECKNCHMTQTNNQRMAELIDQWLTTPESTKLTISNTWIINSDLFHDPIDQPFEKYYKRID